MPISISSAFISICVFVFQRLVEDTENVNHHEGDHQLLYGQEAEGGIHTVNEVPEAVAPTPITSTAMSRSYYNLTAPVEHKEVGAGFS